MENNQPNNKIMIYLLAVFFAIFVGTGLFLTTQSKSSINAPEQINSSVTLKQENMVIPTSIPTIGSLSVTGEESYPIGGNVVVNLSANSNGENIVGYDVVLYYDPTAFEFVSSESKLGDFTIYPNDRGKYLFLTSVKSVGNQEATILGSATSETAIATLSFKPKKIGKYNFSLRQSAGKEQTDLVTDQTEVLSPALADLAVEVIQTLPD